MSRLRRTQFELFAAGDDLPLFVGTPVVVGAQELDERPELATPVEPESLSLFSHETIDNVIG